jgi:hypothetical protein
VSLESAAANSAGAIDEGISEARSQISSVTVLALLASEMENACVAAVVGPLACPVPHRTHVLNPIYSEGWPSGLRHRS